MKTVLPYCKAFFLLIAAYFVFAVLSCLLPDKGIKANIEKSIIVLSEEGAYPKTILKMDQCRMDNFTDALIMNQIYNINRRRPVHAAMKVVRSDEVGRDWDQIGLLHRKVKGEDLEEADYPRYWHGSTFLYRFFFMTMDLNLLRWWLFAISTLLMVALFCVFYRESGLLKTLALALSFVVTCGFMAQFSLQFFPILALTAITCLLVVKRDPSKGFGILFFIVGSLTCYFDLLTTPLVTLGIPLAVMLSLKRNEGFLLKDNLWEVGRLALLWGFGFALTFVTKWALATLFLDQNTFVDAFNVGLYRLGAEEFTRWDAVARNFNMMNLPMICIATLLFLVINVVRRRKLSWKKAVVFLFVGLMPYVWYFLLSNHSYLHWWFTYRLQAISVISLFFMTF